MNVELLLKIAEVIQAKPDEFDIDQWHSHGTCNTTHCIGGWSQVISGAPQNSNSEEMAALLGIEFVMDARESSYYADEENVVHAMDDCQAGRLFYADNWPDEFSVCGDEDCDEHPYGGPTAAAAIARIHHFIATEGRE